MYAEAELEEIHTSKLSRSNGLGNLGNISQRFDSIRTNGIDYIQSLKLHLNQPDKEKPPKEFILSEICSMTDIPRATIRDKEKAGQLEYKTPTPEGQNRKYYNFDDLDVIRDHFNKGFFNGKTARPAKLEPIVLTFAMLKGGVAKTTQSTHLAAGCALSGLKTLFVDLDPQASATLTLGKVPELNTDIRSTICDALIEDPYCVSEVVQNTHYGKLDIIPSGLELQVADLVLTNEKEGNQEKLGAPLYRLKQALEIVKHNYDVVIIDCPPAHSALLYNSIMASNAMIMPVTPTMLAFGSSISFTKTLSEFSAGLVPAEEAGVLPYTFNNDIFRVVITNDPENTESRAVSRLIRSLYGDLVLSTPMVKTIALERSQNDLGLLFDIKRSDIRGSKESFTRGLNAMDTINKDILWLFREHWGLTL